MSLIIYIKCSVLGSVVPSGYNSCYRCTGDGKNTCKLHDYDPLTDPTTTVDVCQGKCQVSTNTTNLLDLFYFKFNLSSYLVEMLNKCIWVSFTEKPKQSRQCASGKQGMLFFVY